MVLAAYGVNVPNEQIRGLADEIQGTTSVDSGVSLEVLVQIAGQAGLRAEGLYDANRQYHVWTMADIIREIRSGNPVVTLVHYATLPAHAGSASTSDHYIVIVGVTSQGFVINDPAAVGNAGYRQLLRPDALLAAWSAAGIHHQGVAFLPPGGHPALQTTSAPVAQPQAIERPPPVVPTMDAPLAPAPVQAPAVVATPTKALPPPPNATVVAWSLAISSWEHPELVATIAPVPPSPGDPGGQTVVLAERSGTGQSPLPIVVVVVLIGGGALAILRAPRRDDFTGDF